MSHIVKMQLEIKNQKALKKAAEHLGLVYNEAQKSFRYYGSSSAKCDAAIYHETDSRQIGVVKNGNQYELQWDPGYLGKTGPIVGNSGENLKREYAVAESTLALEEQGLFVTRYDQKNGDVHLEAEYA